MMKDWWLAVRSYLQFVWHYFTVRIGRWFFRFESRKDSLVSRLVRERGKWARPFVHSGVVGLVFVGVTIGPSIVAEVSRPAQTPEDANGSAGIVLGATTGSLSETINTLVSEKPRSDVIEYKIQDGDTVSSIADKFGVSADTIYWENNITQKSVLKPGSTLRILPATGVRHSVGRGETIYSIAKKYDVSPQSIADWPFNSFINDETFALAVGQMVFVPDGVKPDEVQASPRQNMARQTPDAGTVVASGDWVWPTQGRITQFFAWYHPALDIANPAEPPVVAADSGKVILVRSYSYGYGNHIMVDHGNGFVTLYAHLSAFRVEEGQTVSKGSIIGIMGTTGRSTGPHLHFEIRKGGVPQNPLGYLK